MFGHIDEALFASIKKPNFTDYAIAWNKRRVKERLANSAAAEARYNHRNILVERKNDLERRYKHIAADNEYYAANLTAENIAQLQEAKADYQEATNDLAEFDAQAQPKPVATRPPLPPHILPFLRDAETFLRGLSPNLFFKHVETPLPQLKKGEELRDLHDRIIGDAEAIMRSMCEVEAAPLPLADALAKFTADVESRAKRSEPKIGQLFRANPRRGDRFEQGRTYWPEEAILHVGMDNEVSVQRGTDFVIAIFKDDVLRHGERLIRERAKTFKLAPISLAERPKRLAAFRQELFGIHRSLDAIESELRKRRIEHDPFPYGLDIRAILRIEPDLNRKLPTPEDRSQSVTTKLIPSRT